MASSIGRAELVAAALERGRVEFAAGRWFSAHEAWEVAWRLEDGPRRRLLQGLIMAAGAYQKMAAGQPRGMVLLLERALERLAPLPDGLAGLELDRFRAGIAWSLREARAWLRGAPPPAGPAPLGVALTARDDAPASGGA